jgi:hypothetical protein
MIQCSMRWRRWPRIQSQGRLLFEIIMDDPLGVGDGWVPDLVRI